MNEAKSPTAMLALILSVLLWGSALSVVKIALLDYDPLFLVFIRLVIAFLVLTPIVLLKFRPIRIHRKRDFALLILLTLCDPVGFFTFEALAMQYTSASQAGMMWALAPLLNTMAAWVILRERTTLPILICFVVALGGVVMLTAANSDLSSEHAANPVLGNFLEFLSLCGAAGFLVILRFLRGKYPALLVVWLQCLGGSLFFLPAIFLGWAPLPETFHWDSFLVLLYLGAGITFGAQALSAYAVARLPIARFATIGNLIPVVAVLSGLALLAESMLPLQWVACGVVFAAVLASQYFHARQVKAQQAIASQG